MPTKGEPNQEQPGLEHKMENDPIFDKLYDETKKTWVPYEGSNKLVDKVAVITGGDSGIGRAVAILFAKEGADVVIVYKEEETKDAQQTQKLVSQHKVNGRERKCELIPTNLRDPHSIPSLVQKIKEKYQQIDILVNNAGEQHVAETLTEEPEDEIQNTFQTNIVSMILLTRALLPLIRDGGKIINSTSVTAYRGSPKLITYSSTKGAIVSFTRSLAMQLSDRGIRVNAVAPGPILTPLIPSTFTSEFKNWVDKNEKLPLGRIGQPAEVATCFVFLASRDSSYITGQTLHPNGGTVINS